LEEGNKKRVRFIINPISGIGRKNKIQLQIQKYLDHTKFDHEIVYTEGPKHAIELSKEAAQAGFDVVVAVGGDGSAHEVGLPLIGTNTALAIIPAGSGNGLARYLKLPMDHKKAIQRINNYTIRRIDTGVINNDVFLSTTGMGFDAFIAWKFALFGPRGLFSYVWLIFQEYFRYKPKSYKIEVNGEVIETEAFVVICGNSNQWGNNAIIAPKAEIDDGMLDLAVCKPFPFYAVFIMASLLFAGSVEESPYMTIYRAPSMKITQTTVLAHVDGEPVRLGRELNISVNPLSLNVLV
jgi:diacylglycerol kinase (ATP)